MDLIAKGHSYEQILGKDLSLTYIDIFTAAREAVDLLGRRDTGSATQLDKIRRQHPRAYEIWTPEEEARLSQAIGSGRTVEEISVLLERQSSAIRSRMLRLGLIQRDVATL